METTRASLLIRIRDRDDSRAWAEFDSLYRPMLERFALVRGLDRAAADDVVQHAMMSIHAHIDSFQYDPNKGRFKSWLKTIVNNRVRNLLAARREANADSVDLKRPDERVESPDDVFDQVWMNEHLAFCLARLREQVEPGSFQAYQRLVLEDRPVEEVCAELGLNANQLYSIKFRLTKRLGELMRELVGEDLESAG